MTIIVWPVVRRRKGDIEVLIALIIQKSASFTLIAKHATYRFVKYPVMDLELDPGGSKKVQGSSRNEAIRLSRHKPIAD